MTYWYRIRAFNGAGNSPYSNEASVVTHGQIPEAPSNLRATAVTRKSVSLAWNDNSLNESGFYVERSLNRVDWIQIATLGRNKTSYQNSRLLSNTTYYYRVRAFNANGVTAYTAPVSARTLLR